MNEFTAELDSIVRTHSNGKVDGASITAEAEPKFQRLLSDMSWLDDRFKVPEKGGIANYMLAKAPDDAWTVVSVVWWPGYGTPVHDHLIWGLVGVWDGVERESRYDRLDDGSTPGYAKFVERGTSLNQPSDVSKLVPPDDDYHLIYNPGDKPAMSIHIYGGSLDGVLRHQYNLETGEVTEFRSKYNIAC